MALTDFAALLKASIGLDVGSVGAPSIERAVQERLAACGLPDRQVYWDCVRASATELQALIEAVVVSETWFFRHGEAFTTLAGISHQGGLRTPGAPMLRLLSLPSSTGEEPYSMAMALIDAGLPADRFRVDAVDISARAIAQAKAAVYGRNSFRGQELTFRDRHFEATTRGHRLNDTVRRQVHCRQANMFDADFLTGRDPYDVVFCRNLLIYFDRPTQDRAVGILRRLLAPDGALFVAPSETSLMLTHGFEWAKIPLACAFRQPAGVSRGTKPSSALEISPVPRPRKPAQIAAPVVRRALAPRLAPALDQPVARSAPDAGDTGLDEAVRLADKGRFVDAASFCNEHLRRHGPSAKAFYLLGLVRDVAGNPTEAADYYRKALYLDPQHHDTLVHLAFLVEQQGDSAAAQLLRKRARRVEQRQKV